METSRTEAVGTDAERIVTTQWHDTLPLPTLVTTPGKTIAYTYASDGRILTVVKTDTGQSGQNRTTTFSIMLKIYWKL